MNTVTHSRKTRRALGSLALAACCALTAPALADDTSHRDHMPGPGRRPPPPEAFSACEGKSEGDTCNVSFREETLAGTCVSPQQNELFCLPDKLPPPPGERPDGPPPR